MEGSVTFEVIARVRTQFATKFGVPRQSGLCKSSTGIVEFMPAYRNPDAVRGLDGFSHIWLIWRFDTPSREGWAATVRPPKLGGNTRVGVFATRSPFRPNPIALSLVKLERVEPDTPRGPLLHVSGADMVDLTEIFDIKPYLPYADCRPDAKAGFVDDVDARQLDVRIPQELLGRVPQALRAPLIEALKQDPRPSYQRDPERHYGMPFAGLDVRFTVSGDALTVFDVVAYRDMPDVSEYTDMN